MPTLTPYLDGLILTAVSYPSGFSHSLYAIGNGRPEKVSTLFLAYLALPYLIVAPAVCLTTASMSAFHAASAPQFALAVALAPLALLAEFAVHALVAYRATGRLPLRHEVHGFWSSGLSAADHLLLLLIALGEEIFYRVIIVFVLTGAFGLPIIAAVAIGALAYGLNHLAFGGTTVASKAVVGLLYGGLYVLCGRSVWPPFIAHAAQNLILLVVNRRRNG